MTLEGALAVTFVPMAADEAAAHARRHYGLEGPALRFATEKDDTFRLTGPGGRRFVLKIANPSEDPAELDFQSGLLGHIARVAPDLPVPRIIRGGTGADAAVITDAAGQQRRMRLMSYLEGTPLDSVPSTPGQREQIGRMLARLRLATAGFNHPVAHRSLPWDVKTLPTLTPLLDEVDEPARRAALRRGFERFMGLMPRIGRLRRQVVHNDFSQSNIVVDPGGEPFVRGIIDFGDAVHTAVAIDVSTAVLNQLPRDLAEHPREDIFAAGRDVVRGYLAVADLDEDELDLVPHLVMGRVVARALITLWRARVLPENATYILRNTEQGWAQLDWFLAHPPAEVSARFRAGEF